MNNKQMLKISHVWSARVTGSLHFYCEPKKPKNNLTANKNFFRFMLKRETT